MNFCSHETFVTISVSDQNNLSRTQLGEPKSPKGLHVDKYIFRALTARQEAKALGTIEPLHQCTLQPAGRRDLNVRANRWKL